MNWLAGWEDVFRTSAVIVGTARQPRGKRPRSRPAGGIIRCSWLFVVLSASLSACADADNPTLVPRETFVEVYVALRAAELRASGAVISDGDRDRILAEHEVSEDDLRAFAAAHGRDAVFMEELWTEVQSRMVDLTSQPDREDP